MQAKLNIKLLMKLVKFYKAVEERLQNVSSNQLKKLIKETIKDQIKTVAPPLYTYVKSYTQFDCSRILETYKPQKFHGLQYDDTGGDVT